MMAMAWSDVVGCRRVGPARSGIACQHCLHPRPVRSLIARFHRHLSAAIATILWHTQVNHKPVRKGAGEAKPTLAKAPRSRARVQDCDRAAVLRPAGNIVADRNRALFAVGDRPHPALINAARTHEGTDRLGATGAE